MRSENIQKLEELEPSIATLDPIINKLTSSGQNIFDFSFFVNDQGVIQSCSRNCFDELGYNAQELIGHPMDKVLCDKIIEVYPRLLHDYLETGSECIIGDQNEVYLVTKDHARIPCIIFVSVMISKTGKQFIILAIKQERKPNV